MLKICRLRTRIFRPDRALESRHGSPGCEAEVFGEDGLLKRLEGHAEDARCSLVRKQKKEISRFFLVMLPCFCCETQPFVKTGSGQMQTGMDEQGVTLLFFVGGRLRCLVAEPL